MVNNRSLKRGVNERRPFLVGARTALRKKRAMRSLAACRPSLAVGLSLRRLLLVLVLLYQCGCSRGTSGNSNQQADSSAASPKTQLVPLTNMVLIKAGSFLRLKYPVTLTRDFWLGKYEVTQGEYEAVTGKNFSHFKGDTNRPVEQVSYVDALAYCSAVTKRERPPITAGLCLSAADGSRMGIRLPSRNNQPLQL